MSLSMLGGKREDLLTNGTGVTGIGKNLALLEMNKTLPLLFRDYELELLRPQDDLKYRSTFFVVQHGLDVRISKRNGAA